MVTVTIEDGKFVIHGSFDFGYMGVYHDDEILILRTPAEVCKWETASAALDTKTCSDDDIAAFLTEHLNAWEEKVRLNKKRINDNFLVRIFEDLEACAYPFWETEGRMFRSLCRMIRSLFMTDMKTKCPCWRMHLTVLRMTAASRNRTLKSHSGGCIRCSVLMRFLQV